MVHLMQLSWSLLAIVLSTAPILSLAGPGGTGGGDGLRSTPQQVEFFIAPERHGALRKHVETSLHRETKKVLYSIRYLFEPHRGIQFRNPRVKEILAAILALPQMNSLDTSTGHGFVAQPDGAVRAIGNIPDLVFQERRQPCRDPISGQARDASVRVVGTSIQVCLSSTRLARYNVQSYPTQITSIVMHELVHAAGFRSERDANLVQDFVLSKIHKIHRDQGFGHDQKCTVEIRVLGELGQRGPQIFVFDDVVRYNSGFGNVPGGGRMIQLNLFKDYEWEFNWTPGKSGHISFPMLDGNGALVRQHLTFSVSDYPKEPVSPWIGEFVGSDIQGDITLEGQKRKPEVVLISSGCAL